MHSEIKFQGKFLKVLDIHRKTGINEDEINGNVNQLSELVNKGRNKRYSPKDEI